MKSALLIVDIQKEFYNNEDMRPNLQRIFEHVNYVSGLYRKHNQLVVHIQHNVAGGEGNKGFEIVDEIEQGDKDLYFVKSYGNSFWKTDLEKVLKENGIDFVLVCGFAALNCVLATFNGAKERGFSAAILQHGIAGFNIEQANMIYKTQSILSYNVAEYIVKNCEKVT